MSTTTPRELLRTRCTLGWLVITESAIRIERKGFPGGAGQLSQVMPRQALIGVTYENTTPSVFGLGGGGTLTFSGYGMVLIAKMVVRKDAQQALAILGYA